MGGLGWIEARGEAESETFYKLLSPSIHSFSFLLKAVQLRCFRVLNVQENLPWILQLHAFSIVIESESCSVMSDFLQPHGLYSPWNSGLQWVAFPFSRGIFPTQGSNPGLLHCRRILYQLSYQTQLKCKTLPVCAEDWAEHLAYSINACFLWFLQLGTLSARGICPKLFWFST